jgi:adenylate cyclase
MNRLKRFQIKNAMMIANGISNLVGILVVHFLRSAQIYEISRDVFGVAFFMDAFFAPLSFALVILLTLWYERPIRRFLSRKFEDGPWPADLEAKARRRLLNEPFFLIALDMATWLSAAVLASLILWNKEAGAYLMVRSFFLSFHTGLITTTVAFFVFEFILQRRVFPFFFPEGNIYAVSGIFRISIRARLIAMLFACNLIPFFSILSFLWQASRFVQEPAVILQELKEALIDQAVIFMGVGLWVTFLVSSNLTRPLRQIIQVLRKVREGRFDERVRVTSNDEIGYTGDVINEMCEGLRERDFIKDTFGKYVTREIRDEILNGKVLLNGELKEVTVLFADLRNFTPLVEKTPPKEVVIIINGYFKEMEEAIKRHHGLVLHYIGDQIFAVFGAPLFRENHPALAVRAAREMQHRLQAVNLSLEQAGYPRLSHGIGIDTGRVLAANIGSPDRLSYTLVGDTVNVASRLQELNKEFNTEIILSGATRARINGDFLLKELPATRVKGKSEAIQIFSLQKGTWESRMSISRSNDSAVD